MSHKEGRVNGDIIPFRPWEKRPDDMDLEALLAHRDAVHEVYVRHMHGHGCMAEFDGPECECRIKADASAVELREELEDEFRPLTDALNRLWGLRRQG